MAARNIGPMPKWRSFHHRTLWKLAANIRPNHCSITRGVFLRSSLGYVPSSPSCPPPVDGVSDTFLSLGFLDSHTSIVHQLPFAAFRHFYCPFSNIAESSPS